MRTSASFYPGLVVLAALAPWGCDAYTGSVEGEHGMLGFYEPNRYPVDTDTSAIGFERPLALGARADVWVTSPGISSLSSASVDDDTVLGLVRSGYPLSLRGVNEGTARLHVATSSASDTLPITVVRPDGVRLWQWSIDPIISFAIPDSAFGSGQALRPNVSVTVAAEPLAGSTPLLGFDFFEWTVDPMLIELGSEDGPVNTRRLTTLGVSGVAHVSTQLGGDLQLVTLGPSDPIELHVFSIAAYPDPPTEIVGLVPADAQMFAVAGHDAGGRLVVASSADRSRFSVTAVSGSVRVMSARLSGQIVELHACAGGGTVRISYLGATRDLPIEVTADVADPSCTP